MSDIPVDQGESTVGAVEPEQSTGQVEPETPTGDYGDDSLASGFLQRVPEEHRSIVEPYVKQWDAGVTRRFQELHSTYDPYKSFADDGVSVEDLNTAMQLMSILDTNPNYLYQLLKTELEAQEQQQVVQQNGNGAGAQGPQVDDPYQGLHPVVKQQLEQQQVVLEALAQNILQNQSMAEQQKEDKQLDDYLGLLRTEFGQFDEDFVLSKMASGIDGPDAVKAYHSAVQQAIAARDRAGQGPGARAPAVLSGGGSVLGGGTDVTSANDKDIKNFVSNILAQTNRSG